MRMSRYHDPNPRPRRLDIELREIMDGVDRGSAKLKELPLRNRLRPNTLVIVSTYSCNRRYGRQPRKYVGVADVATMNDTIAAL